MGPEYLGCSDMLDVKKAGDITVHSPYPYESHLDDSLYDPVNAPETPLLCANRLVQEVTV